MSGNNIADLLAKKQTFKPSSIPIQLNARRIMRYQKTEDARCWLRAFIFYEAASFSLENVPFCTTEIQAHQYLYYLAFFQPSLILTNFQSIQVSLRVWWDIQELSKRCWGCYWEGCSTRSRPHVFRLLRCFMFQERLSKSMLLTLQRFFVSSKCLFDIFQAIHCDLVP